MQMHTAGLCEVSVIQAGLSAPKWSLRCPYAVCHYLLYNDDAFKILKGSFGKLRLAIGVRRELVHSLLLRNIRVFMTE